MICKNCGHDVFELKEGIYEHSESFEGSKKCEANNGRCECILPEPEGTLPCNSALGGKDE